VSNSYIRPLERMHGAGAMAETIEGGCRCGRVRYRASLEGLPNVYACHCRDCQTWSGSAFSLQFMLPEDQFEVNGETQLFELTSSDGARISPAGVSRLLHPRLQHQQFTTRLGCRPRRHARPQRRTQDRGPYLDQAQNGRDRCPARRA
jgi:hypothetical protein